MAKKKWASQFVVCIPSSQGTKYYDGFGFTHDRLTAVLYPERDQAEWRASEERARESAVFVTEYIQQ